MVCIKGWDNHQVMNRMNSRQKFFKSEVTLYGFNTDLHFIKTQKKECTCV